MENFNYKKIIIILFKSCQEIVPLAFLFYRDLFCFSSFNGSVVLNLFIRIKIYYSILTIVWFINTN